MEESVIPFLLKIPSVCKETSWLANNVVGILTGILTLLFMLYIYKIQQKDNAIQEARNILLSPNSFGNEKKRALETLAKHKRSLAGVKICGTPERLVNLNGLDLSIFSIHHTIDLYNIFFLCCDLQWAQFDGRDLSHTEFNNSMLQTIPMAIF
jgi:hypothetical protein